MAGPSSGGKGTSVASDGSVEMGVGRGPSSRVGEETGSALDDIRGTGGEETTAENTTVVSTPRTSQEETLLRTGWKLWTKMKLNPYPYFMLSLCVCMHFPLLKLKLQSMLHP